MLIIQGVDMIVYPVNEDAGLGSQISDHFGRSFGFMLVEPASGTCRFIAPGTSDGSHHCAPLATLKTAGATEVYCKHMSPFALRRCFELGLLVYETTADRVDEALQEHRAGLRVDLPDEALCAGHEHHDC
ncbi:MAG: hypothetical protein E1N59_2552 [Puniceicoccaceae bacterium 5H]|nr:MAG: hypothetical protein E1N59_2552 [Puniceicoccaceae bacterium 5H]